MVIQLARLLKVPAECWRVIGVLPYSPPHEVIANASSSAEAKLKLCIYEANTQQLHTAIVNAIGVVYCLYSCY